MPKVEVIFYREDDGSVPALHWLDRLEARILDKFTVRIEQLQDQGWDLSRPAADLLRDGVHELRVRLGRVNYRLLYFFIRQSKATAVLSHGLTKEDRVPDREIELAVTRKQRFETDPEAHTYREQGGG